MIGADIGGHRHHHVAELDLAAEIVAAASVVEDVEADVEDVGVRLLDLVPQHDLIRIGPHRVGHLAAGREAVIAGGAPISLVTSFFSMNSPMS